MSYREPKFTVQQEFAAIPSQIVEPLQVCIIGPSRRVFEYSDPSDKVIINRGAYDPSQDTDYAYAGLPLGAVVDQSSVGLVIEKLWAKYATITEGGNAIERGSAANILKLGTAAFATSAASTRNIVFKNRDVKVGDRVKVTAGLLTLESRVIGLKPTPVASSASVFTNGSGNLANRVASDVTTTVVVNGDHSADGDASLYVGSLLGGYLSDTYTLTCTTGGIGAAAVFSVTSLQGDNLTGVVGVALGSPLTVGTKGLAVTISGTGAYVVGEQYTIAAVAPYNQVTPVIVGATGADYSGAINTIYTVTVTRGGTWADTLQVAVSTNNGIDYAPSLTVTENGDLNLGTKGVAFKFPLAVTQDGLLAGETYTVSLTAASDGPINQLILADGIDSSIIAGIDVAVDFHIYKESKEIPVAGYPNFGDNAVTTTESDFTITAGLQITDPTWVDNAGDEILMDVKKGTIFVPYSAILVIGSNSFNTISDLSSLETVLGKLIPANPLAYGVLKALENSNGQPINYVAIESDDLGGYESALAVLERNENAYFNIPLTHSAEIINLYKAHVLAMSDITHQLERVEFVSRPLSTTVVKYGIKSDESYWTGYVSVSPSTIGLYNQLHIDGASFLTDAIRAGDSIRLNFGVDDFGNETYTTVVVGSVVDEQNLIIAGSALAAPYGGALPNQDLRIDILRNLTRTEQAESIAATSSAFDSRRVLPVWPDLPIDDAGREVSGFFLACSIAGLKSSVAPHQGITNYTLNGWSDMSRSFKYFTPTQLNIIAAGGTTIVTQDVVGGPVYIRHQLTSDQSDANHGQLSITTNLDSITKFIRGDMKNFIGKYNATPTFERIAHAMLIQKLAFLQNNTITETAGGQITSFDPNDVTVTQHPLIRTTVTAAAKIGLPYPVDNFDLVLTVV